MIDREMEYRESKSVIYKNKNITVKEQRVDGHRCVSLMHVKYILMDLEINYQIRIPSNQLIILTRSYTSLSKNPLSNLKSRTDNLNPWFLTGLSDGESNFTVSIYKSKSVRVG